MQSSAEQEGGKIVEAHNVPKVKVQRWRLNVKALSWLKVTGTFFFLQGCYLTSCRFKKGSALIGAWINEWSVKNKNKLGFSQIFPVPDDWPKKMSGIFVECGGDRIILWLCMERAHFFVFKKN